MIFTIKWFNHAWDYLMNKFININIYWILISAFLMFSEHSPGCEHTDIRFCLGMTWWSWLLRFNVSLPPPSGDFRTCRLKGHWRCHYPPQKPTLSNTYDHCPEVRVCVRVCLWWLCAADLCVLLQKESPTTSRQSPANGHPSINSSILVRTTTCGKKTPQTDPQSSVHWCIVVFLHVFLSFYIYLSVVCVSVSFWVQYQ